MRKTPREIPKETSKSSLSVLFVIVYGVWHVLLNVMDNRLGMPRVEMKGFDVKHKYTYCRIEAMKKGHSMKKKGMRKKGRAKARPKKTTRPMKHYKKR